VPFVRAGERSGSRKALNKGQLEGVRDGQGLSMGCLCGVESSACGRDYELTLPVADGGGP
jgi:hypothetical protein